MQITTLQVPYEKNYAILVSETRKQQWLSNCFVMWSAYCLFEAEQFQISTSHFYAHAHLKTHPKLFIRTYPPLKRICEANECPTNNANVSWAHTHNKPWNMNDIEVAGLFPWCFNKTLHSYAPIFSHHVTGKLHLCTWTRLPKVLCLSKGNPDFFAIGLSQYKWMVSQLSFCVTILVVIRMRKITLFVSGVNQHVSFFYICPHIRTFFSVSDILKKKHTNT